jgi:C4-type Zn-finger protein
MEAFWKEIKTDCPKCGKRRAIKNKILIVPNQGIEFISSKCHKCGFKFRDPREKFSAYRGVWKPKEK